MKELRKNIEEKLEALEKGSLELSELEGLVEASRELYERLLIVKYKAYEKYGEPQTEEEQPEAKVVEAKEEIIEEVAPNDFTAEEEVEEAQPSFDFSMMSEEKEEATVSEEVVEEEETLVQEQEEVAEDEVDIFKESHTEKVEEEDENSLNQKLKGEDHQSLRKKLQSSPVSDIKKEISIAKKFEYITFMFDGKNDIYEAAIEDLNNCSNGEEAKNKLNEYSTKYKWDLENKSIIKFVELVERRYL